MKCERCKNEKEQIEAEKTSARGPEYKVCRRVYMPKPKERTYSKEIKKQAIKLYMEGYF